MHVSRHSIHPVHVASPRSERSSQRQDRKACCLLHPSYRISFTHVPSANICQSPGRSEAFPHCVTAAAAPSHYRPHSTPTHSAYATKEFILGRQHGNASTGIEFILTTLFPEKAQEAKIITVAATASILTHFLNACTHPKCIYHISSHWSFSSSLQSSCLPETQPAPTDSFSVHIQSSLLGKQIWVQRKLCPSRANVLSANQIRPRPHKIYF